MTQSTFFNEDGSREFRVLGRLAIGRSSEVVLARACDGAGGTVVVKRFRARDANAAAFDAALAEGATAYAELSHPGIAALLDFFRSGDQLVVMREHVDGLSLKQLSARLRATGQKLDGRLAIHILAQVFSALASAHAADVVHGNLHPSNVLVSWDGHVHVTDFCVGRASRGLTRAASKRADVFAGSVMLGELLSGQPASEVRLRPERVAELEADPAVRDVLRFGVDRRPDQPWLGAEIMARVLRGSVKEERERALLVMALDEARPGPESEIPPSSRGRGDAPDSSRGDRPSSSMIAYAMTGPEPERAASPSTRAEIAGRKRTEGHVAGAPKVVRKRTTSSAPPPR